MIKKLVLVPYDKYQRMLETTGNPKTVEDIYVNSRSTQMTKLADEINMSPPLRKKMKPKIVGSDDIVVIPPPPGKRDIPPGRRANMPSGKTRDWISF